MQNGNKTQINAKQQTGVKNPQSYKQLETSYQNKKGNEHQSKLIRERTNSGRAQKDKTEGGAGTEVRT